MAYTAEDYKREVIARFTPKERVEGLSPEDRLEGLSPEDLLKGLSPKAIEAYLNKSKEARKKPTKSRRGSSEKR